MVGPGDWDEFARSVKDLYGCYHLVGYTDAVERALDERHRKLSLLMPIIMLSGFSQ